MAAEIEGTSPRFQPLNERKRYNDKIKRMWNRIQPHSLRTELLYWKCDISVV